MLDLVFSVTLLLSGALSPSTGPCGLATSSEVERVLGGAAVEVPASEIGEETAPGCLWASASREVEIKLTIWSADELPVLGLKDARSYFAKLKAEFAAQDGIVALADVGEQAFAADFTPMATMKANGTIVVLKSGRVIVFEFSSVFARDAHGFAANVVGRI